jgi:hypothetical protein
MGPSVDDYRFLFGNRKGDRQLGRSTLRRVANIKMELQEVECGHVVD